jgi:hypothetical protein
MNKEEGKGENEEGGEEWVGVKEDERERVGGVDYGAKAVE